MRSAGPVRQRGLSTGGDLLTYVRTVARANQGLGRDMGLRTRAPAKLI